MHAGCRTDKSAHGALSIANDGLSRLLIRVNNRTNLSIVASATSFHSFVAQRMR